MGCFAACYDNPGPYAVDRVGAAAGRDVQLAVVFRDGTYLARRLEEEQGVNLYHLPADFFAELYYNPETNEVERVRSFTSCLLLEDYTPYIELPQDLV